MNRPVPAPAIGDASSRVSEPVDPAVATVESLYRQGRNREVAPLVAAALATALDDNAKVRLLVASGMALSDLGDHVTAVKVLSEAVDASRSGPTSLQFSASFALFVRHADFLSPEEALPGLSRLRQLAMSVGDAQSLAGLHLAVARLEACRGHCVDAHRHLEIARRLGECGGSLALQCAIDLAEASLESVAGNLVRFRVLAEACLERAKTAGFSRYAAGAATNLGLAAISSGNTGRARQYLQYAMQLAGEITHVQLCALDNLAQAALFDDDVAGCRAWLDKWNGVMARDAVPSPSWYDFSNHLTRCAYLERLERWSEIVDLASSADAELARRQFKAVRTTLLCAKARALSRLGQPALAEAALATAVRCCPRGAVDPLIVLEATHGICLSVQGDLTRGSTHFDRALAACRAIGHRYHESWIARDRAAILRQTRESVAVERRSLDLTDAALLLSDVATILGAGHSIDLLAHRVGAILQGVFPGNRVDVRGESGRDYRPDPSTSWDADANGTFSIRLRGSDRLVSISVRRVAAIDEISLLKSVADFIQAAVNRAADSEAEDENQNLWPRFLAPTGEDIVFQSPRMTELLKIAVRLATTNLPVLLTGETGTGKEIVARLIHKHSLAKRGPFVPFNCSVLPRDLVESQLFGHRRGAFTGATEAFPGVIRAAEHGTLFLDEIGDLDPAIQPKLLRFLESAEVHPVGESRPHGVTVRVVAATNADLETLAAHGRFRRDLFYRLGVATIALPPLRERKDEIPAMASLFLGRYARECQRSGLRLADDFIAALLLYDWPGNIRQLANEIRRIVALADNGDTLGSGHLSPEITKNWHARPMADAESPTPTIAVRLDQPLHLAIGELEQKFIAHAMGASGGRVADAAELLGLSRKGLFLKRRRWGLVGQ